MVNGNKDYQVIHWNIGSSFLENKIEEVERVLDQFKPAILSISEANLRKETELIEVNVENYILITTNSKKAAYLVFLCLACFNNEPTSSSLSSSSS